MAEYVSKTDVLNLPQSIERNLCGEIVERSIDVKDIESLEPADVVPVVHGHWIPYRCDMYECSVCQRIHTSMDVEGCDAEYCPHCGAKMDGEE